MPPSSSAPPPSKSGVLYFSKNDLSAVVPVGTPPDPRVVGAEAATSLRDAEGAGGVGSSPGPTGTPSRPGGCTSVLSRSRPRASGISDAPAVPGAAPPPMPRASPMPLKPPNPLNPANAPEERAPSAAPRPPPVSAPMPPPSSALPTTLAVPPVRPTASPIPEPAPGAKIFNATGSATDSMSLKLKCSLRPVAGLRLPAPPMRLSMASLRGDRWAS